MEVVYERDPDVGNGFCAYRGCIQRSGGDVRFEGVHFEALIRLLHHHMRDEDRGITFTRSDRPGMNPYPLEATLVELIRMDPAQAAESMSAPEIRVVVGRPPATPTMLRTCADTLASAFGENVMCRAQGTKIECPGCGKWQQPIRAGYHFCPTCNLHVKAERLDANWVLVSVPELLEFRLIKRFFLPREWNGFKPWVTRKRLKELYASFLKAKEQFDVCK